MAALKYRKHQVLDGFTAFILCTKMSLCKIEEQIKKYPQTYFLVKSVLACQYNIRNPAFNWSCSFMNASETETCVFIQT